MSTEAHLVEAVLVRCTICRAYGPRDREREHWIEDHRLFEHEASGPAGPRVPTRFHARLAALSQATGASTARLVAIALDDYYGCAVPTNGHRAPVAPRGT